MWELRKDNRGVFTLEAVFVMLIVTGIILSILYVSFVCLEKVNVESKFRDSLRKKQKNEIINGLFGEGEIEKAMGINILSSKYKLTYKIPFKYPLTKDYLDTRYNKFTVTINLCNRDTCDFIRMYDALRNKE